MNSTLRRAQIVKHLIEAKEHVAAAMKLLLEENDPQSMARVARLLLDATVDPRVDTTSTSAAKIDDVKLESKRRASVHAMMRPIRAVTSAFKKETAIAELSKAWRSAQTADERAHIREIAKRLVMSGLLCEGDVAEYLAANE